MAVENNKLDVRIRMLALLISIFIGFYGGITLYYADFYVHEGGHIVFGQLGSLIVNGILANISISNHVDFPFFPTIKIPQQTHMEQPNLLFAFGGILATIIVIGIPLAYLFDHTKIKTRWFILTILLLFFIRELNDNFICGTDNLIGKPYTNCGESIFGMYIGPLIPFLIAIAMIFLIHPSIKEKLNQWFKTRSSVGKD